MATLQPYNYNTAIVATAPYIPHSASIGFALPIKGREAFVFWGVLHNLLSEDEGCDRQVSALQMPTPI